MRTFRCDCGNTVYFENTRCLNCGSALAFDPQQMRVRPVAEGDRLCANHADPGTCNWLATDPDAALCVSCSLNDRLPDLGDARRVGLYHDVEKAKRRLLYTLHALGLPVEGADSREHGLAFRILADARLDGGTCAPESGDAVFTGHLEGCITINLLEADPHLREGMRLAMNEPYRTLLGHFRHESGHYYWHHWRRRADAGQLDAFRALFGDERAPYQQAMQDHYRDGPPADWQQAFVTAYAASHPLEDFAECWAHYLHLFDTLETAADAGLAVGGGQIRAPQQALGADAADGFGALLADWRKLAPAMNDLNRSMGMDDPYPFALPPAAAAKLRFIHECFMRPAFLARPAIPAP